MKSIADAGGEELSAAGASLAMNRMPSFGADANSAGVDKKTLRRVVASCAIGNALEWYDFFLYGTAAALVFGQIFFPKGTEPIVAALAVFGGFAVGFLARPVGGMIFAHIGDKYGRRISLIITIFLMGASTFLMGLLPTYAQMGVWAPILLVVLRVFQGLAAGGEWGGSVLMITENAPANRIGFFSSIAQAGLSLGFLLSAAAVWLARQLPDASFIEWGWRIPFLASILIFGVGTYIRRSVPETRAFLEMRKSRKEAKRPLIQVLRDHPRAVLITMGLRLAENGSSYVFVAFSLTYAKLVGVDSGIALSAMIISFALQIPLILWVGSLADRIGARPIYIFGVITMALFAIPFFRLLDTGSPILTLTAFILVNTISYTAMVAVQPKLFSSLFGTSTRYSGLALGHEISAIFSGGLSPLIATFLFGIFHASWPIVAYLCLLGAVTLVAAMLVPRQLHA